MMSHINSYLRAELGGRSPYDVFSFMYGTDILDKLNIRRIEPSEVVLKHPCWTDTPAFDNVLVRRLPPILT